MLKLKSTTLLGTVLALAGVAHAQRHAGGGPPSEALFDLLAPGYRQHAKEQAEAIRQGAEAEERGDYAAAEVAYRRACAALGYDCAVEHLRLARLFDKTGDGRKAFVEYRVFVVGDGHAVSSDQSEPAILAHFGDLCLRYGPLKDAKRAYALAILNGRQGYGDSVILPIARDEALPTLRSAAHTAVAIKHRFSLERMEEEIELNLALEFDPQNWVARIYRAEVYASQGLRAAATLEAMRADRTVGEKDRWAVVRMRWTYSISDDQGKLPTEPIFPEANSVRAPDVLKP